MKREKNSKFYYSGLILYFEQIGNNNQINVK